MRPEPQIDDMNSAGEFVYPEYAAYAKDLRHWYKEECNAELKRAIWDMELRIAGGILIVCSSHWIVGVCIFFSPIVFSFIETFLEEYRFQRKHINKPADEVLKIKAAAQK